MLEVVIAMGILGFGLLTLALMQMEALTQGAAGRHTGEAAAAARTYIEQVHRVPWSVLTADVGNGWSNPGWSAAPATWTTDVAGAYGGAVPEHTYDMRWRVNDVAGTSCLRDVEVRVTWDEENRATPKQLILATRRYNWGGSGC